jgi:DNA-binding transcriptional LysR family regulator
MEVRQFAVLVALADHGTFPNAAAALGVPLATVRARLQAAEREAGVKLVRRRGRGVELTEAGQTLLPLARRMLRLVEQAHSMLALPSGGRLSIGTVDLAGSWVLRAALGRFLANWPNSQVTVLNGRDDEVLEMLVDGRVRLGFVTGGFDPNRFHSVWATEEPVSALVGDGAQPCADAAAMPVVCPGGEGALEPRLGGRRIWRVGPVDLARELAAQGRAALVLPASAAREQIESGRLRQVQMEALCDLHLSLHCLVERTTTLAAAERRFLAQLPSAGRP